MTRSQIQLFESYDCILYVHQNLTDHWLFVFLFADSSKLLCFRYYGGINLLCFAQSEPVDFESTYKLASENVVDEKGQSQSSLKKAFKDTVKKKDAFKSGGGKTTISSLKPMSSKQNGYSSESESENECTSAKHRKKGRH